VGAGRVGYDWGAPLRLEFLFLFFYHDEVATSLSLNAIALLIFILFYCYERGWFHFSMVHQLQRCTRAPLMGENLAVGGFWFDLVW